MSDIPPDILNRLRSILIRCDPFSSGRELQAVFVDARISQWRNNLPSADNLEERVDIAINFLHERYDSNRRNGLVDVVPPSIWHNVRVRKSITSRASTPLTRLRGISAQPPCGTIPRCRGTGGCGKCRVIRRKHLSENAPCGNLFFYDP